MRSMRFAVVAAAVATALGTAGATASERFVTVVGEGQATAGPDVAELTAGVVVLGPSVQQAMEQNRAAMTQVLSVLEEVGVAAADISTTNYSIHVEQPRPGRSEQPAGEPQYRVSNMVRVRVRDLARLDHVLGAVAGAGANEIYGVNMAIDDPSPLSAQARELAVRDARQRAAALAGLHDAELGQVLRIEETNLGPPMARMAMESAMGGPIRPGEMTVSARIQVTYELR